MWREDVLHTKSAGARAAASRQQYCPQTAAIIHPLSVPTNLSRAAVCLFPSPCRGGSATEVCSLQVIDRCSERHSKGWLIIGSKLAVAHAKHQASHTERTDNCLGVPSSQHVHTIGPVHTQQRLAAACAFATNDKLPRGGKRGGTTNGDLGYVCTISRAQDNTDSQRRCECPQQSTEREVSLRGTRHAMKPKHGVCTQAASHHTYVCFLSCFLSTTSPRHQRCLSLALTCREGQLGSRSAMGIYKEEKQRRAVVLL